MKKMSGTCPYFEDILHPPLVPDDDHDGWDHSLNWILPEVSSGKLLSGTSIYLKDVLHPPEVPDGNIDDWGHLC